MKEIISNIGAIGMALLVLVSTVSFTVDKHFCGSMLMDMAIMHRAEACAMEKAMEQRSCDSSAEKPGCCSDEHIVVHGQDDLKMSWEKISLDDQQFLIRFTYSYLQSLKDYSSTRVTFDDYAPPLIIQDIQLLNESFLI